MGTLLLLFVAPLVAAPPTGVTATGMPRPGRDGAVVFDLAVRHPEAADLTRNFVRGMRGLEKRGRPRPGIERWDEGPPLRLLAGDVIIAVDGETGTVFVKCDPKDVALVAAWVRAFDAACGESRRGASLEGR